MALKLKAVRKPKNLRDENEKEYPLFSLPAKAGQADFDFHLGQLLRRTGLHPGQAHFNMFLGHLLPPHTSLDVHIKWCMG